MIDDDRFAAFQFLKANRLDVVWNRASAETRYECGADGAVRSGGCQEEEEGAERTSCDCSCGRWSGSVCSTSTRARQQVKRRGASDRLSTCVWVEAFFVAAPPSMRVA